MSHLSTFSLASAVLDDATPSNSSFGVSGMPSGENPIVHVIDDDPKVRDSIQFLLESVDFQVKTYPSAGDFLSAYDRTIPGCLVLDVRLRGMSGLELQERLRGDGLLLPVIVISGHGDIQMAVRAMKGGAVDFLQKPIDDQTLIDHVNRAIELDQQRRRDETQHREISERYTSLTDREKEVMNFVILGASSREVGDKLGITFKTVEAHRAKITRKMQAKSVAHLIYLAHILRLDVLQGPLEDFEASQ